MGHHDGFFQDDMRMIPFGAFFIPNDQKLSERVNPCLVASIKLMATDPSIITVWVT